jgi:hypothetical protein
MHGIEKFTAACPVCISRAIGSGTLETGSTLVKMAPAQSDDMSDDFCGEKMKDWSPVVHV